ncbi:MAG TPA: hypothetical protein PKI61_03950 [bacterium]|nr:hypothetical protein [bacterium]HPT29780.1 hypothetical protein [bacterium]
MKIRLKINYLNVLWVAFYIFLLAIFLRQSFAYLDPDLGWHLKTGQQIVQNLELPRLNEINYPLQGQKWIDHEWLSNVVVYEIYTHWGYLSLTALFALIFLSTFYLLNWWLKKRIFKEKFHSGLIMVLEIAGVIAIAPHLGIRIQMITTLGLLLTLIILDNYQARPKWQNLLWLIPLFYLWASLHAGFLVGFIAVAVFWGAKMIEKFINSKVIDEKLLLAWPIIVKGMLISLLAAATTLLTPYFLELYSFLFGYRDIFYLNHISEWLPQWAYPYIYPQFIYLSSALVLFFFYLVQKRNNLIGKINLWQLLLTLVCLVLAIKSRRNFPLFFIASLPLIADWIRDYLKLPADFNPELSWLKKIISLMIALALLLTAADTIAATQFIKNPFTSFCEDKVKTSPNRHLYPCAATEFLKKQTAYQNYNLFNNFGWGGYLIWVYPQKQLFIDGRGPQASYRGHSILAEYYDFWNPKLIGAKLQQHDVRLILTKKRAQPTKLSSLAKNFLLINEDEINQNRQRDYLLDYLEMSREWKLIYQDDLSLIYVKP